MSTQRSSLKSIYCAGPLFNSSEKKEMEDLAKILEGASFTTFLPHRDGLEFSKAAECLQKKGVLAPQANSILSHAIFALDVFQVIRCDGLLLNMNGRVPDEGAMVEAGIAWAQGKKIVIFKNDARTLLNGVDNPLVLGLSNFYAVNSLSDVASQFKKLFEQDGSKRKAVADIDVSFRSMVEKGKEIYSHMNSAKDIESLCEILLALFGKEDTDDKSYRAREAV